MTFAESISSCLSKYAVWKGRASRSEFWWFQLACIMLFVFAIALVMALLGFDEEMLNLAIAVVYLATVLPNLAVTVRRLHDCDKSGWWYWIVLLPILGAIILFVFFCQRGTAGENRYGPDPLQVS